MSLNLLGVNHKSAPVELRERLAIPDSRLAEATRLLVAHPGVSAGIVLSTCNRVELLTCSDAAGQLEQPDLLMFLGDLFSIAPASLRPHVYELREQEAMRHLFRVASSLDSMVIGEPQILGQVKQSYSVAREVGAVNGELDAALRRAFTVAKRVRTETKIGESSVERIATVAVDLARKIFGSLAGKTICLLGTGKMGQLAARHLMKQGASRLLLANRTLASAAALSHELNAAGLATEAIGLDQMLATLEADIVITTTGAERPIFLRETAQAILHRRKNRPVFFIDIAVPRDVDPAVNKLEGVFVYDIDDLQNVAAQHRTGRSEEAERAEMIIEREVERFHASRQALDAVPAIVQVQRQFESLRQAELQRSHVRLASLDEEERAAVDELTRSMMAKLLHGPLTALKTAAREGDLAAIEAIRTALAGEPDPVGESAGETNGGER